VRDALTTRESLSQKATGAFSVVTNYISSIDNSKHSKAVRIAVTTDSITSVTPYLMELLGQLVVASTCDLSHSDTRVYCDCSSVVQNINSATRVGSKSMASSAHGFLLRSLQVDPMPEQDKVEWTRSHPERRKDLQDIASWSDQEKGIFAADAAAGNEPHLLQLRASQTVSSRIFTSLTSFQPSFRRTRGTGKSPAAVTGYSQRTLLCTAAVN
jgi:hypothetical protein